MNGKEKRSKKMDVWHLGEMILYFAGEDAFMVSERKDLTN
jgi:hypothetical protein